MSDLVTLAECPPGLFLFNGSIGIKTEYGIEIGGKFWPEAFCADTGEYFWGGTSRHEDRAKLLVQPISASLLS